MKQVELNVYFSFTVKCKIWYAMQPQRAHEPLIRTHCLRYCKMSGIDHSHVLTPLILCHPVQLHLSHPPLVSLVVVLIDCIIQYLCINYLCCHI
jgi:hypothetical protein